MTVAEYLQTQRAHQLKQCVYVCVFAQQQLSHDQYLVCVSQPKLSAQESY